jgi:SAM-dependent methyltransferase
LSIKPSNDKTVKLCCATFYQSDVVRMLFGDIFHPGGLLSTSHLGRAIGLEAGKGVLDVACGRGTSAVHLAETFGCHVTGVDYGADNIAGAEALADEKGMSLLTDFRRGDAEGLPFDDGAFDAVISECSFCTFPDKHTAATEMVRVLKPGGRLGMTDMTISGPLPDDIQSLLSWVACIAGADTPEGYVAQLAEAGFVDFAVEDQRGALLDMITDIRRKLLGAEIAVGLGKLDLGDIDLDEGKRLARRGAELIENGTIGYTLIAATRG